MAFSDGFICSDSSMSRKNSMTIRNSIAIQYGYDIKNATVKYYWDKSKKKTTGIFS
ncbi:MAG: hypothetical protein NTZ33_05865 [Bacteroidetes bacterium]|nr:hypothetical protein [Bacteroidota bacterium]